MGDLGLLMADPLAQACAEGRKTVTRRPLRIQPPERDVHGHPLTYERRSGDLVVWSSGGALIGDWGVPRIPGAGTATVGQRVWVRECWAFATGWPADPRAHVRFRAGGESITATVPGVTDKYGAHLSASDRWRPSSHMPKWAARTWGTLVSVTPCDLSDIDDAEAQREGFDTAAEFLAEVTKLYPGVRWFWRLEIEWDGSTP